MKIKNLVPLLAGLLCATVSLSQDIAEDDETFRCDREKSLGECVSALTSDDGVKQKTAEAKAEESATTLQELLLKLIPTGVESGGQSAATTTKDFDKLVAVTGFLSDSSEVNSDGNLVVDFKLPFKLPGKDEGKLQLVVDPEPGVPDGIKELLPEAMRDDLATALGMKIGEFDDISLELSWNLLGARRGRNWDQYSAAFGNLVSVAKGQVPSTLNAGVLLGDAQMAAIDRLPEKCLPARLFDLPPGELVSSLDATDQEECRPWLQGAIGGIFDSVESRSRDLGTVLTALRNKIDGAGLDRFGALVSNQPQLSVSAKHLFRDDLVGGQQSSLSISYEKGRYDLNGALSDSCATLLAAERTPADGAALGDCAAAFQKYVEDHGDEIDTGGRFSFSLEYEDRDDARVDLAAQDLDPITLTGGSSLVVGLGWGRMLSRGVAEALDALGEARSMAVPTARLDLNATYEDVEDDPARQSRLVGSLTITRKFGGVEMPFAIVYANRGEFLTDVDEQLSTHFGIKFSGFDQK